MVFSIFHQIALCHPESEPASREYRCGPDMHPTRVVEVDLRPSPVRQEYELGLGQAAPPVSTLLGHSNDAQSGRVQDSALVNSATSCQGSRVEYLDSHRFDERTWSKSEPKISRVSGYFKRK